MLSNRGNDSSRITFLGLMTWLALGIATHYAQASDISDGQPSPGQEVIQSAGNGIIHLVDGWNLNNGLSIYCCYRSAIRRIPFFSNDALNAVRFKVHTERFKMICFEVQQNAMGFRMIDSHLAGN